MKKIILNATSCLIALFATLDFNTSIAQTYNQKKDHIGFSVSFGAQSNKIESEHEAVNDMNLHEEGGSIGLLWGNNMIETKLTVGYYYSAARVPHTVDLVNLESAFQFYPLNAISGRTHKVEPYLTSGLAANNYKFHGFYAGQDATTPNYSVSIEPYLGNVTTYFASLGAGLQINLLKQHANFVKLFSEVNYQSALYQKSSELLKNTRVTNPVSIKVGVSFGLNRLHH